MRRRDLRALTVTAYSLFASSSFGCTTLPSSYDVARPQAIPPAQGSYYEVQPGETLWRIAHDFGVDLKTLATVNRLPNPRQVQPGQRLFIPSPLATNRFLWPARGQRLPTGATAVESVNAGLEILAQEGSFVRASRTGRVAVASRELAGVGKTIILDHGDGYTTIYAGLDQILVNPGLEVQQGNPIGTLGHEPLYFEIRRHTQPHDPQRLLP